MSKELNLEPSVLTIFGITGDLAHRKLLPALYHLAASGLLPKTFKIVGTTRQNITAKEVLAKIKTTVEADGKKADPQVLAWLKQALVIVTMDISKSEEYTYLKKQLDAIEDKLGQCLHRLFYLAVPSSVFKPLIQRLGQKDLNSGCQHGVTESRLLIEKPFGYDLISAKELVECLNNSFKEKQIYRIDHYLAKETVQNIMTLRFNNPLLNSVWDGQHIHHIMITAAESIGIEGRANFYEQTGALRDIIQSHLLQVLALVTMDQPKDESADAVHTARQNILEQILPPQPSQMATQTVRAQYKGYTQEVSNPDSETETYAAIQLHIQTKEWSGTPIFMRTGKQLAAKTTEVILAFSNSKKSELTNYLTIRIQPNEGIVLDLSIKQPGYDNKTKHVQMEFCYDAELSADSPDAYERVLVDTLRGDKTLFATSEAVLASWRIIQPILDAWQQNRVPMNSYEAGSWGPKEAQSIVTKYDANWAAGTFNNFQPKNT